MAQILWSTDVNAPCCPGEIVGEPIVDGDETFEQTLLIQSDWDFPGVAQSFGWSLREVQQPGRDCPCDHDGTDGTVPCKACGLTQTDFISAAYDWLRDNNGVSAEDPGYFN